MMDKTVHLIGRYPVESMPFLFSQADVMLVTLKKEPIFAYTIPGKVQSYLACGRPIIAAIDGEGAKIVRDAGAGFTCPAEDPAALAQAVMKMYETPKLDREMMGMSGRRYYEANFDRNVLLAKLDLWMKESVVDYTT
jgi:glycosyltransferase involved in cell wall biosynthesis